MNASYLNEPSAFGHDPPMRHASWLQVWACDYCDYRVIWNPYETVQPPTKCPECAEQENTSEERVMRKRNLGRKPCWG